MNTTQLLEELAKITVSNMAQAEKYLDSSLDLLNFRANEKKWSVLECLAHLNRYGDYYLPEIKKAIQNAKKTADHEFKAGMLGNYFAKSMLPKEKLNTMKTFKSMNPLGSDLDKSTVEIFIAQQKEMLSLLEAAKSVSLTKNKTGTSISRWIKLRLGDTLRVVIYHNWRHIIQAQKALTLAESK